MDQAKLAKMQQSVRIGELYSRRCELYKAETHFETAFYDIC